MSRDITSVRRVFLFRSRLLCRRESGSNVLYFCFVVCGILASECTGLLVPLSSWRLIDTQ